MAMKDLPTYGALSLEWLKQRGPDDWHRLTLGWNWDHGMAPLKWIVEQPDCDKATALQVFWLSGPDNVLACADLAAARRQYCHEEWAVLNGIAKRWSVGGFTRGELAFNNCELVDEAILRERVQDAGTSDFAFEVPAEMFLFRDGRQLTALEGVNDGVPPEVAAQMAELERG